MSSSPADTRRPLASRSTAWASWAARTLARSGATPNQVSVASVVFAGVGAGLLVDARPLALVGAAACVQLRLLCNLLDGMIAVEGGRRTRTGVLYNEVPDRIADSAFLVAAGIGAGVAWLGWLAALAAMLTAYVRALGGALDQPQDFRGPMAKPHRMAALTAGCIGAAIESATLDSRWTLVAALGVIAAGALVTAARRLGGIAARLP